MLLSVTKQGKSLGIQFTQYENKKRHQYSESECGMYCLYFIISLLQGISFKTIENKKTQKYKI